MENILVEKLKGFANSIYTSLGNGFEECIYQKAFEVDLRLFNLPYENQRIIPVYYRGFNVGESKADLVVCPADDDAVVVEIKAIQSSLSPKEEAQLKKYMESTGTKYGLLINFPQSGRKGCTGEVEFIVIGGEYNASN